MGEAHLHRAPESYPRGEHHPQFGKAISESHRAALRGGARRYNGREDVKGALSAKMAGNKLAKRKLSEADVAAIKSDDRPSRAIGNSYGVCHETILRIRRGTMHAAAQP